MNELELNKLRDTELIEGIVERIIVYATDRGFTSIDATIRSIAVCMLNLLEDGTFDEEEEK